MTWPEGHEGGVTGETEVVQVQLESVQTPPAYVMAPARTVFKSARVPGPKAIWHAVLDMLMVDPVTVGAAVEVSPGVTRIACLNA